jgi:hypothetical protein
VVDVLSFRHVVENHFKRSRFKATELVNNWTQCRHFQFASYHI